LVEQDLDAAQLAVYRAITEGPRSRGKQVFQLIDERGALNGPFGVLLHAPRLGAPLQELGSAVRYGTAMTGRCREIAILLVAVSMRSEFEWYAHAKVGEAAGLQSEELEAIRAGTFVADDPLEQAVALLCSRLLADEVISDEDYSMLVTVLGEAAMVEVTVLVGYYKTLAQLMHVFNIGAPPDVRESERLFAKSGRAGE
jgi:4-carboxymuconolactone decarboxylase